jgi:hypothetical protein
MLWESGRSTLYLYLMSSPSKDLLEESFSSTTAITSCDSREKERKKQRCEFGVDKPILSNRDDRPFAIFQFLDRVGAVPPPAKRLPVGSR